MALIRSVRLSGTMLAGCALLSACGSGSANDVYAISVADAKARIGSTQAQYTSGSQTRIMRPAGPASDGIRVSLPNAGTFASSCVVRFEEIDAASTRIFPDCGETGAAVSDVAASYFELEIEALIHPMMTGEPVDAQRLGKEMAMLTLKKMPAMNKEGFAANQKWVQEQTDAAVQRVENEQDGWGEDVASAVR